MVNEKDNSNMTIKDIAKKTGYAVSTVSRALNDHPDVSLEAKEKILAVASEHHFVPNANARNLKQTDSKNIVILVKGTSNMLFTPMVENMQVFIRAARYTDIVQYIDEDANEVEIAKQLIRELKPQGIVFLGGSEQNFQMFRGIDLPCVLLTADASQMGYDNLSSVCVNDFLGAKEAMSYLLGKGHKRIGIIGGQIDVSSMSKQRYLGCLDACKEYHIPYDEKKQYAESRYSFESAYRQMHVLLENNPQMTAIFAMSDVMAIAAIRAILDKGLRVPEDISVIGFDGIELAFYSNPKLATIIQDQKTMINRGVEILLNCIQNKTPAVYETAPFTLAKGESVKSL